jgi:hypothetical protein
MSAKERYVTLSEATLCSLGLLLFSFFIHHKFPARVISFVSLLMSAFIISRNLRSVSDLKKIIGENLTPVSSFRYIILGTAGGLVLSILYRWHLNISLLPSSVHFSVFVFALIGCTEEFVFRGFLQEHVRCINGPFSVLFSTLSHTCYKCCLFLSPAIVTDIDIAFLALWTFGAGIIFGSVRHLSKSLLPSVTAHALFDFLVYAEYGNSPWWIW